MAATVTENPNCECVFDGCHWTRTITYSYPAETTEQREIRLLKDRVAELEGKAKPPKSQTVGQQMADKMVQKFGGTCPAWFGPHTGTPIGSFALARADSHQNLLEEYIARAIDKAIADEREECAKLCDKWHDDCRPFSDVGRGIQTGYEFAAKHIRDRNP